MSSNHQVGILNFAKTGAAFKPTAWGFGANQLKAVHTFSFDASTVVPKKVAVRGVKPTARLVPKPETTEKRTPRGRTVPKSDRKPKGEKADPAPATTPETA
jgi:hypothetical protein